MELRGTMIKEVEKLAMMLSDFGVRIDNIKAPMVNELRGMKKETESYQRELERQRDAFRHMCHDIQLAVTNQR